MKLTVDSFIFHNSSNKSGSKKITHTHKKKKAKLVKATPFAIPKPELQQLIVSNHETAHILQQRKIYIEKKLYNYNVLKEMAEAMGAIVKEKIDKTVTDYVTDLKSGEKQLKSAANNGIPCVSPIWLMTCYGEKKYLPPIRFPIDLQTNKNCLGVVKVEDDEDMPDEDNPFGLEEIDYDYLEAHKPGAQLKLDGYVTRATRQEGSSSGENSSDMGISQAETIEVQDDYDIEGPYMKQEEEDDEEAKRKEFYYNSSSDLMSSNSKKILELSPEEIAARNQRKNNIAAKLQRATSSSSSSSNSTARTTKATTATTTRRVTTRSASQRITTTGIYGQDKFSVWYGEQEFKHVSSKK